MMLLVGILLGYWAKEMITLLRKLYANTIEKNMVEQSGVVKPTTQQKVVDLTSESGVIPQLTPAQYYLSEKEREARTL